MDDAKARFHIQRNLGFAAWLISDLLSYFWSSLLLRRQGLVSSPSSSRWTGTNIAHSLLLCIVSLATQASGSHCQECPVRRQRHHPQFTVVVAAGRGHSSKRARRKWVQAWRFHLWLLSLILAPTPPLVAWRQKQSIREARPDAINERRNCVSCGPGEGHPRHSSA